MTRRKSGDLEKGCRDSPGGYFFEEPQHDSMAHPRLSPVLTAEVYPQVPAPSSSVSLHGSSSPLGLGPPVILHSQG